jgi:hypothetical protein
MNSKREEYTCIKSFIDKINKIFVEGDKVLVYIYNDENYIPWILNENEKYTKIGLSRKLLNSEDFKSLSIIPSKEYRKQKLEKLNSL